VDSATTAIQNGACTHSINAFPNKCTIKHPFHTTAIHEKSGNLLNHSVLSGKNKLFDNIILTGTVYYPKWFK
jgi:hypothetical protein